MKLKKLSLLAFTCFLLSSCFEIEEIYNFKEDGSYQAEYSYDMGKVFDMFGAMIPDSVKETKEFTGVKDTVLNFGNAMPDKTAKKLSAEEKQLLAQTNMRMQMNIANNLFKISFKNQGKNTGELNFFLANFAKLLKESDTKKMIMNPTGGITEDSEDDSNLFSANQYDYVITKNSFQRKIKAEFFQQQKEKNQQSYDVLKSMNMKMPYTVVINLPRPVLSIDNPKAILSVDKRQFKLTFDMIETLENPEVLNFKITY